MIQFISSSLISYFWMAGGQFGSAWRKYGGGAVIIALVIWKHSWLHCPLLLICPALFLGYGEKSWFMKHIKNETLVRLADAGTLGLPILITGLLTQHGLNGLIGVLLLVGAFQIRGGGFKIGNKDFLWPDLVRSTALSAAIWMVLQ